MLAPTIPFGALWTVTFPQQRRTAAARRRLPFPLTSAGTIAAAASCPQQEPNKWQWQRAATAITFPALRQSPNSSATS